MLSWNRRCKKRMHLHPCSRLYRPPYRSRKHHQPFRHRLRRFRRCRPRSLHRLRPLFNRISRGHHRHKPCNLFRHRSKWIRNRSSGKLSWGFLLRFLSLQRFSLDMHFCPVSCRWLGCSSLEQAFPLLDFTEFLRRSIPTFS